MITTHRIGGVVFRTETDAPLLVDLVRNHSRASEPRLPRQRYLSGSHGSSETASVEWRAQRMRISPISGLATEKARIPGAILASDPARARLASAAENAERVTISVNPHAAIVGDFATSRIDVFYLDNELNDGGLHVASNLSYIFGALLSLYSAVIVHASGVVVGGRAALFLAGDGGGKTTVSQLRGE